MAQQNKKSTARRTLHYYWAATSKHLGLFIGLMLSSIGFIVLLSYGNPLLMSMIVDRVSETPVAPDQVFEVFGSVGGVDEVFGVDVASAAAYGFFYAAVIFIRFVVFNGIVGGIAGIPGVFLLFLLAVFAGGWYFLADSFDIGIFGGGRNDFFQRGVCGSAHSVHSSERS